ncbi:hypothetical protein K431DRAFT_323980 [Polychaeton citri CBS 116435]|uniref:C2H2-type domain-containing protein n=1 Tax=Polychaeton citri CBS 116435 TaxID=1314669 RepID=A0A9P4PY44_9PEZI|nr:hypothetical protein K431DRAFT_323980 [Polychaeton citri CBS 116435]
MEQNYPPMRMSAQQPPSSEASSYGQAISSSPALYQSRSMAQTIPRRQSEFPQPNPADPAAYEQAYRRISNPYDSNQGYSVPHGQGIPPLSGMAQSPQPSPSMNASASGSMSSYTMSRSPSMYDTSNMYGQQMTSSPPTQQMYAASQQNMTYPPPFVGSSVNEVLARPLQNAEPASIRVLNQRPKPQCWEHGCNGRQFSTFSNLLRHQREKSGTAAKSYCPRCGAEFTRTTARNGHLAHDKCSKQRRPSEEK